MGNVGSGCRRVNYTDPFGLKSCRPQVCLNASAYIRASAEAVWNRVSNKAHDLAGRVAIFARGNAGSLGGELERDFAGRSAARYGPEFTTDAVSAEVGLRMDLESAPAGSNAFEISLSRGVRTRFGKADIGATVNFARGPDGKLYWTSIDAHGGAAAARIEAFRAISGGVEVPGGAAGCKGDRPGCR